MISEKGRQNIREAVNASNKRRVWTVEMRQKKGDAQRGDKNWNYGKHLSLKTKRKITKANSGEKHWCYGKHFSIEHCRKIGEANKGEKNHFWGIGSPGEKNSSWKGGITPLTQQIRKCFKNRQWRSDVFTRDDFTCVLCGKKGGYINADHYPKSFSDIFCENKIKTLQEAENCEVFWNINNGRTLCVKCHNKTKKGWRKT